MLTCVAIISLLLNLYLIPTYGLNGAAIATTFASLIGMIGMSAYVYKKFKALIEIASLIKILIASIIVAAITFFIAPQGILLIIEYLALFGLYLLLLWLMQEINKEDIEIASRIMPFKIRWLQKY